MRETDHRSFALLGEMGQFEHLLVDCLAVKRTVMQGKYNCCAQCAQQLGDVERRRFIEPVDLEVQ